MKSIFVNLLLLCLLLSTSIFSQQKIKADDKVKVKTATSVKPMNETSALPPLDTLTIERVMGVKGKASEGEYKITIPQNDLSIMVDGFKIIPAMGLGTWIAFT